MGGRRGRARGSHGAWVIYSLIYSTLHISELPWSGLESSFGRGYRQDTGTCSGLGKRRQSGRLPGGDDATEESCSLLSEEDVSW